MTMHLPWWRRIILPPKWVLFYFLKEKRTEGAPQKIETFLQAKPSLLVASPFCEYLRPCLSAGLLHLEMEPGGLALKCFSTLYTNEVLSPKGLLFPVT